MLRQAQHDIECEDPISKNFTNMNFNNLNQSDWQNVIYLVLLLVLLVTSFRFNAKNNFPKILKYLAIWSLIGLVVIILYAFRYEFSDFKNRILGEINPSAVQVGESGELIINIAQDGHFYADVTINNNKLRFMIDTGASDITISLNDAKRIGINVEKLNFNKRYNTANGVVLGASISLDKVEIGDMELRNISASVNNADMDVSLLGMSFLKNLSKYEFYRDRLVLKR
jgi:aspartyl protease family protein